MYNCLLCTLVKLSTSNSAVVEMTLVVLDCLYRVWQPDANCWSAYSFWSHYFYWVFVCVWAVVFFSTILLLSTTHFSSLFRSLFVEVFHAHIRITIITQIRLLHLIHSNVKVFHRWDFFILASINRRKLALDLIFGYDERWSVWTEDNVYTHTHRMYQNEILHAFADITASFLHSYLHTKLKYFHFFYENCLVSVIVFVICIAWYII